MFTTNSFIFVLEVMKFAANSINMIIKFFQLMGTVFGFVSSDVKSKVDILESLLNDPNNGKNFQTFKSMIEYEKNNDLLDKEEYTSGSRTLLRLHRGLDFIREFLKALGELDNCQKTSHVCQIAYNNTLAKFHPWLIKKGANVAMYTMPTREVLLKKVCGDEEDVQRAITVLPKMLSVTADVYKRTDDLYSNHDLHDLP
ncbi:ceramide-1-phosphate transfer protein-like [Ctenocephalides felis]|uniref:ceramide-1-phosphate transfer protein-like n=1 Tax=Ctenocephalides felis TaxID=7515 RepID=UPI000E6E3936|nr:ceramide-1-phosphate transfer protein-like [Ctenocephalides felis]